MLLIIMVAVAATFGFVVGRTSSSVVSTRPVARDGRGHVVHVDDGSVSTEVLRDAIDRLEFGVLLTNASGGVIFRNASANALAGTHEGLVAKEHVSKVIAATLAGEETDSVVELHGPPKQMLLVEAEPIGNGGVIATIRDITERVRNDEMRTDFVANISHELRTPMGAIAVLADVLADVVEDATDPATVADLAMRMVAETHRAVGAIDDLLELSQIESHQTLDDIVDVSAVVGEAIERGRVLAAGRQLDIVSIGLDSPLLVQANRTQLLSAMGNLVENAVKYSPDGGVVHVAVRVDGHWLELMVADQGVGIPDRDVGRIFERFYRVDKARGRATGGTGLGLSIVRHVAHNHGGDISVSSKEGEGSTFVFRLPARLVVPASDGTLVPVDDLGIIVGTTDEELS